MHASQRLRLHAVASLLKHCACTAGRIVLYHALVFFLWAQYTMLKTRFK